MVPQGATWDTPSENAVWASAAPHDEAVSASGLGCSSSITTFGGTGRLGSSSGLVSLFTSVVDSVVDSTENSCAVVSDVSSSQEAKEKLMKAALAAMLIRLIRPRWADDLGIRYCFHIEAVDERSKGNTLRCSGGRESTQQKGSDRELSAESGLAGVREIRVVIEGTGIAAVLGLELADLVHVVAGFVDDGIDRAAFSAAAQGTTCTALDDLGAWVLLVYSVGLRNRISCRRDDDRFHDEHVATIAFAIPIIFGRKFLLGGNRLVADFGGWRCLRVAELELVGQLPRGTCLVQFSLVVALIDGVSSRIVGPVQLPLIIGPVEQSII